MVRYIYQLSSVYLFILFIVVSIAVSLVGVFIVRRFIPLELRYRDNPVIGNISALISIIYGVLAGLIALYLINNISYTADAVQREANAIANMYRYSKWLKEPVRSEVQNDIKDYLKKVIEVEWPIMQAGKNINDSIVAKVHDKFVIEDLTGKLLSYSLAKPTDGYLVQNMLGEIRDLYNAREQRIHMSLVALDANIWIVLIIGTILTIVINYFFGMNFYLHLLTVSAVALMAAAMMFLLVTLDRPFQGELVIAPAAFNAVLTYVEKDTQISMVSPEKNFKG